MGMIDAPAQTIALETARRPCGRRGGRAAFAVGAASRPGRRER